LPHASQRTIHRERSNAPRCRLRHFFAGAPLMFGGLLSRLQGKQGAGPQTPVSAPAAPDPLSSVRKWLADDTLPAFALPELRAEPRRYDIAVALSRGSNLTYAQDTARELLAENPASALDRMLLVDVLLRLGRIGEAQPLAESTLADGGRMGARAAAMLAERALFLGQLVPARALAERALAAAPESPGPHVVLGCVLDALGPGAEEHYAHALGHYRRALALKLEAPMPRFHLACSLLRQGLLREGLAEWVMVEILGGIYANTQACPVWNGQPLGAQSLLLIGHSGLGDMIQFLRFARQLREREPRARLALLVSSPVARLAEGTGWFDQVYRDGMDGAAFDWQVTLTHLPLLLDVQMDDLRKTEPYLKIPAPQVQAMVGALPPARSGHRRVGLRWAGNSGLLDAKRNVPLTACAPLFALPGIDWVALVETPQEAALARQHGLAEVAARITDFQDTGALMAGLDLIVSVDTSVANLAGALNLPTWLMSRPDPDWRWGKSGAQSPWFGSVRVFRHPRGEMNWDAMVAEIGQALKLWSAG
jgi:tetratricopeptide (TPR) repeat protein